MTRTLFGLTLATLLLGGCAAGGAAINESPTRYGVHLYAAPAYPLGDAGETTVHPVLGYSRVDGSNVVAVGGQLRRSLTAAEGRLWVGGEGSLLRISGLNGWSAGGLAGYTLPALPWSTSVYGYLGYLDAFGTGFYGRVGLEVQPAELMELLPR